MEHAGDAIGGISLMAVSEQYDNGFLAAGTMESVIRALDNRDSQYVIQGATQLLRKYRDSAALPKLVAMISDVDDIRSHYASIALRAYGSGAAEYLPELKNMLTSGISDAGRMQLDEVIEQIEARIREEE